LTSTATRPLYQPQLGHTMWGNLDVAHWGQTLRAGRDSVQFAARRLRVLALLVLRFGTAIDLHFQLNGPNPSHFFGFTGRKVRESEFVKCSPARIDRCRAVTTVLISVDSTVRTEPLTVLTTQGRER